MENKEVDVTREKNQNILESFQKFKDVLDSNQNLWENLYKIGREITLESKRLIFSLHRFYDSTNKKRAITDAEKKTKAILEKFKKIAELLKDQNDSVLYAKAYTNGLQEFIEAISFKYFLQNEEKNDNVESLLLKYNQVKQLLTFEVESGPIVSVPVPKLDWVLGLADTTGETMRMCVKLISKVNSKDKFTSSPAYKLCLYNKLLFNLFNYLQPRLNLQKHQNKALLGKMSVLETSLKKCEDECSRFVIAAEENVPFYPTLDDTVELKI